MYFHHSIHVTVLFEFWKTTTHLWYGFTLSIIFALSVLNQFLHFVVRKKINVQIQSVSSDYGEIDEEL